MISAAWVAALAGTVGAVMALFVFVRLLPRMSSHRGPVYFQASVAGSSIRTLTAPSFLTESFRYTKTPTSVSVEYGYSGPSDVGLET
jgi:hypothetical protein